MEQLKWAEYMLPVLVYINDGNEHGRNEIIDNVSKNLKLSEEIKSEVINSGTTVYVNRIGWALTYLKQSGLLNSPKRGIFTLTDEGKKFLMSNPKSMTEKDLEKFSGYLDFKKRTRNNEKKTSSNRTSDQFETMTPDEALNSAADEIKASVCSELLEKARNMSPKGFEKLVVQLLLAMGYGDKNEPKSGFVVGKAGDNGIDGIIKQDKLGFENIYVQAKRYKEGNIVTPHDVRDLCGALMTKGSKGVFITTSDYSKEGLEHVKSISKKDYKIILINGAQLTELMYQYGIGVSESRVITINKVDNDFFDEE